MILRDAALLGPHRLSSIRETEPWGFTHQPKFLNAVAELDTELSPQELHEWLHEIEGELVRTT
jgi:2-amino-4-hydroxy-6-hydroxymethyldihydropteridine diphosphokinase